MCEYCKVSQNSKVSICKPIKAKKTATNTNIADLQIYIHREDGSSLMIFDTLCRASYIDINFCPICGRKLNEVSK